MLCSAVHSEVVLPEVISDYRNSQSSTMYFSIHFWTVYAELFLKNHSSFYVKKIVIIFKRYHSFLIADI